MVGFVKRSPFLQLATCDAKGMPFVSPKGDEPGTGSCDNKHLS
jgi:hypothetical protein